MKSACFATAAALTVKTFVTGLTGAGLARQQVMPKYDTLCRDEVSTGKSVSFTACYNKYSKDVDKDVNAKVALNEKINNELKPLEEKHTDEATTGLNSIFGGGQVLNRDEAQKEFITKVKAECSTIPVTLPDKTPSTIGKVLEGGEKEIGYLQLRDMYAHCLAIKQGGFSNTFLKGANEELTTISDSVNVRKELFVQQESIAAGLQKSGFDVKSDQTNVYDSKNSQQGLYYSRVITGNEKGLPADVKPGTPYERIDVASGTGTKSYIVILNNLGNGQFAPSADKNNLYEVRKDSFGDTNLIPVRQSTYDETGQVTGANTEYTTAINAFSRFTKVDVNSYNNKFENPEVQYYENEPYKGMPALVPFDLNRGWYVATKQNVGFGNIKAFDSSGRPASFWICNVGANHKADFFNGVQDDICQQFNVDTGQTSREFYGLSASQTKDIVQRGMQALNRAAEQYKAGVKSVIIDGEGIKVGNPAAVIPGTQCQDFMSPGDCKLLFNMCDPVICPSSRCNLGGTYPVADVIQTGIVGSALLCLPNSREGILMPVCLTGIKAGIDGFVSVLTAHRDCLQHNLDTGEMIGICDEIYSVYMCEFFWRQIAPVANILLPKLVELAYGQGQVRGGGEYLTVMSAWQNTKNSVDYFKQVYAVNSFKAFQARNIEEAGTEFCRASISAKGPTSIKSLVEPDSPPQFHAYFDSTVQTDATVPPTAAYKVFYHIFAGNDAGIYYTVYLKGAPDISYYATTDTIQVAAGFVPKGGYKDETKDFTAPAGYKELCVNINGQEKCGFKQVSTDFAVNYVRDQFVADQIKDFDIKTEQECVSGTPSVVPLLNPNIQAGAEEAVLPEIYNRGVIRICATNNPGAPTDITRYSQVGVCGDPKIKCWLDSRSVDRAISEENRGLRNATLEELRRNTEAHLDSQGFYNETGGAALVKDMAAKVSNIGKVDLSKLVDQYSDAELKTSANAIIQNAKIVEAEIDKEMDKVYINHQKAALLLLKGELRATITKAYLALWKKTNPNDDTTKIGDLVGVQVSSRYRLDSVYDETDGAENKISYIDDKGNGQYIGLYILYDRLRIDPRVYRVMHPAKVPRGYTDPLNTDAGKIVSSLSGHVIQLDENNAETIAWLRAGGEYGYFSSGRIVERYILEGSGGTVDTQCTQFTDIGAIKDIDIKQDGKWYTILFSDGKKYALDENNELRFNTGGTNWIIVSSGEEYDSKSVSDKLWIDCLRARLVDKKNNKPQDTDHLGSTEIKSLASTADEYLSIACFLKAEHDALNGVGVQTTSSSGTAPLDAKAFSTAESVVVVTRSLAESPAVFIEDGSKVFIGNQQAGTIATIRNVKSFRDITSDVGSGLTRDIQVVVNSQGQIIGEMTSGGKVRQISQWTHDQLRAASSQVRFAQDAVGNKVLPRYAIDIQAELVDANGNRLSRQVGTRAEQILVQRNGAMRLMSKVASSRAFAIFNKVNNALLYYEMLCTGLKVNHAIIGLDKDISFAQDSAQKADLLVGKLVEDSQDKLRDTENNGLKEFLEYQGTSNLPDFANQRIREIKNIYDVAKEDYDLLFKLYTDASSEQSAKSEEGNMFSNQELVEILAQSSKVKNDLRELNGAIEEFYGMVNECIDENEFGECNEEIFQSDLSEVDNFGTDKQQGAPTIKNVIFEFQDGVWTEKNIIYNYTNEWYFGLDGKWYKVNNGISSVPYTFSDSTTLFIDITLRHKTYAFGVEALGRRVLGNSEGGFGFLGLGNDAALKIQIGDKSKSIGYGDAAIIDIINAAEEGPVKLDSCLKQIVIENKNRCDLTKSISTGVEDTQLEATGKNVLVDKFDPAIVSALSLDDIDIKDKDTDPFYPAKATTGSSSSAIGLAACTPRLIEDREGRTYNLERPTIWISKNGANDQTYVHEYLHCVVAGGRSPDLADFKAIFDSLKEDPNFKATYDSLQSWIGECYQRCTLDQRNEELYVELGARMMTSNIQVHNNLKFFYKGILKL